MTEQFGYEPQAIQSLNGGIQYEFRMPNGYGASVIQSAMSYGGGEGLWELAVLTYGEGDDTGVLTYDTPITDDVVGHLDTQGVMDLLRRIEQLPADGTDQDTP